MVGKQAGGEALSNVHGPWIHSKSTFNWLGWFSLFSWWPTLTCRPCLIIPLFYPLKYAWIFINSIYLWLINKQVMASHFGLHPFHIHCRQRGRLLQILPQYPTWLINSHWFLKINWSPTQFTKKETSQMSPKSSPPMHKEDTMGGLVAFQDRTTCLEKLKMGQPKWATAVGLRSQI